MDFRITSGLSSLTSPPKDIKQFVWKLTNICVNKTDITMTLLKEKYCGLWKLRVVKKDGFSSYMKRIGKLGGQNKVPRLTNDRKIADELKIRNVNDTATNSFGNSAKTSARLIQRHISDVYQHAPLTQPRVLQTHGCFRYIITQALLTLKPEIYGTIAETKTELNGLLYVIDRLPEGITECVSINMTAEEGYPLLVFNRLFLPKDETAIVSTRIRWS